MGRTVGGLSILVAIVASGGCALFLGSDAAGDGDGDGDVEVDAAVDIRSSACGPDYAPTVNGELTVKIVHLPLVWDEAMASCEADGARLAVLDTLAKIAAVQPLLLDNRTFIGMSDVASEGTFLWVDGTPVASGAPPWVGGQPDNGGGDQNCGAIRMSGGFDDEFCDRDEAYVCECVDD